MKMRFKSASAAIALSIISLSKTTQADAGWSSLVARRAHNPKVVGSNPALVSFFYPKIKWIE